MNDEKKNTKKKNKYLTAHPNGQAGPTIKAENQHQATSIANTINPNLTVLGRLITTIPCPIPPSYLN